MAESAQGKTRVRVLGGFEVISPGGTPVAISGRKAQALLAILALSPGMAASRERLAGLLWGDRGDEQARNSLRQALVALRKELGDAGLDLVEAERDQVRLAAERVSTDAVEMARLAQEDKAAEAAALYCGALLDGIFVRDAAFEDWAAGERQRLADLAFDVHEGVYEAANGPQRLAAARRLLALDPLREAAHRAVMEALAAAGERDQALRQYEALRDMLGRELGAEPSAETERLKAAIVAGEGPALTAQTAMQASKGQGPRAQPAIAVLPFVNMSDDAEQTYFADGISADIISELGRFGELLVTAASSSFSFRGQTLGAREIAEKLGVAYLVEGSVRRAGQRVRITVQLIEAESGNRVWGERYDRDLADIFDLEDEVVREIVTAIPGQIDVAAIQRVKRRPTESLTAYELLLQAWQMRRQDWGSYEARFLLEKVIAADPQYALAYALLANWHAYSVLAHGCDLDNARSRTLDLARTALELVRNDSAILSILSDAYMTVGEHGPAHQCIIKAIKLNPNSYHVMSFAGVTFAYLGEIEEALRWNDLFSRHDPIGNDSFRELLVEVYYMAERFEDAAETLAGWAHPPRHVLAEAAATHAQAGNLSEATKLRERYLALSPSSDDFAKFLVAQMRMCAQQKLRDLWLEGYRKAGFEC